MDGSDDAVRGVVEQRGVLLLGDRLRALLQRSYRALRILQNAVDVHDHFQRRAERQLIGVCELYETACVVYDE